MKQTLFAAAALAWLAGPVQAQDFTLSSADIAEGQQLDMAHVLDGFGCEGGNLSPELSWSGAPEGTGSFVVTVYDPDAPTGSGWWHWVVFNIPADATGLPRGADAEDLPDGAVQSRTDFGAPGFGGACPPPGEVHRYEFTVHAIAAERLELDADAPAAMVGFMTNAQSLNTATITAIYTR